MLHHRHIHTWRHIRAGGTHPPCLHRLRGATHHDQLQRPAVRHLRQQLCRPAHHTLAVQPGFSSDLAASATRVNSASPTSPRSRSPFRSRFRANFRLTSPPTAQRWPQAVTCTLSVSLAPAVERPTHRHIASHGHADQPARRFNRSHISSDSANGQAVRSPSAGHPPLNIGNVTSGQSSAQPSPSQTPAPTRSTSSASSASRRSSRTSSCGVTLASANCTVTLTYAPVYS